MKKLFTILAIVLATIIISSCSDSNTNPTDDIITLKIKLYNSWWRNAVYDSFYSTSSDLAKRTYLTKDTVGGGGETAFQNKIPNNTYFGIERRYIGNMQSTVIYSKLHNKENSDSTIIIYE